MHGFRRLPVLVSAAMVFVVAPLAGCTTAAQPKPAEQPAAAPTAEAAPEAAPAPSEALPVPQGAPEEAIAPPALKLFQQAVDAYQSKDYERSRVLLDQSLESPEGLTDEQAADARARLARIQSIMHQRELEARQKPAEAEPAPAATAPGPEAAAESGTGREKASALLVTVGGLAAEKKFSEAAAGVEVLDSLRDYLAPDERARYDLLRAAVQAATRQLRPLSSEETKARATDDFASGAKSYETRDYAAAALELDAAASFEGGLGWWDSRKLRNMRADVEGALRSLRADVARARALLAGQEYAQAQELLAKVKNTRANIGTAESEDVDKLLAEATRKLAEQTLRETEERRSLAAGKLDKARALVATQDLPAASAELTDLTSLQGYLSDEQRQQYQELCDQVEKATGVRPGMSPEQRAASAQHYLDLGLNAYRDKRFVEAQDYLHKAAELNADLGRSDNSRLRKTAAEVDETLRQLRADYARGRELFQNGDFAAAKKALRAVKDSGVDIGAQETADVSRLLDEIKQKLEEQRQREAEEQAKQARQFLSEAESLAQEQKYPEARAKLTELENLMGRLSPEQQEEARRLGAAVEASAKAAAVKAADEKSRQLEAASTALIEAQASVLATMKSADEALQRDDPEQARGLLLKLREMLKDPDVAGLPPLRDVPAQLDQKLAAAETALARRAHLADVQRRLDALMREAVALSQTDLLAAEAKALAAADLARQEGLELTPELARARDGVLAAVEARYGPERRLRLKLYAGLVALADGYTEAGEYDKARRVLLLVQEAPPQAATAESRDAARRRLAVVDAELARQDAAVERLMVAFKECDAALRQRQLPQALKQLDSILVAAQAEKVDSLRRVRLLTETVSFLTNDFDNVARTTYPSVEHLIDGRLDGVQQPLARELSRLYLDNGSPELAEPYLKQLVASSAVDAESAAWAKGQLEEIQALKAKAEQQTLLAIGEDAQGVLTAAAKLHEAVRAGRTDEVQPAEQELADARLKLQVKKARGAAARGAYDEAARLLEGGRPDKATPAVVEQTYQPVLKQVKDLQSSSANLRAAEEALASHNLPEAGARLADVQATETDAGPVALRKEVLAAVLNAGLELQETVTGLSAQEARILNQAREELSACDAREKAWQAYYAALDEFLRGKEGGRAALGRVVAQPQGLKQFEVEAVREAAGPPAPVQPKPEAPAAQDKLREALAAYGDGDYLRAQALVDELKAAPEFAASDALRRDAGQLEDLIRQQEARAQELYDEAVRAFQAGDTERARLLTNELKAKYGRTKVLRDHT